MATDTFRYTLSSEPLNRLSKLMMETYKDAADAQMSSLQSYMELLEEQANSATAIRDFKGIKSFVVEQPTRLKQVVTQMAEDTKQFSGIAQNFRKEAFEVFRARLIPNADETGKSKTTGS
ncbi:hypothetical protein DIT71_07970 [Marinobacter vulgaris]|uniref:Phasin domain-containing protein n=1 Tax=Marinobacter vulgaris TaxID=1928331 RepID=A0A2V3ZLK6_9GAMM|nr:phasin family protein [Marinobacter vulgaris]PXX91788.1 hypothetical protein DIT71_07970 [Marinobacter vulgaris]TSJ70704.1 hypothetical protein FPC41_07400 [Marinobacter vulgaris]